MDCSRLSGISNLISTARTEESTLIIWRESFRLTIYTPTWKTFAKHRLRPDAYKPGLKIYVLDEKNFSRFCRASHNGPPPLTPAVSPGKTMIEIQSRDLTPDYTLHPAMSQAVYPLPIRGEVDEVRRGIRESLSDSSRIIVLHRHFTPLELKHELIHDYFMGPTYSSRMRRDIMLAVIHQARRAYSVGDAELLQFFEEVNQRCKTPYQIEALRKVDSQLLRDHAEIGPNLFNYANECFVYAWELLLGHKDPKLGKVPEGLQDFLKKYPIG